MLLPKVLFYLSVLGSVFALGLIVGVYQIFPYQPLKFALNSVEAVLADRKNILSDLPTGYLAPRRYDGDQVVTYDQARSAPGFTLLSGFFDASPGLRLIRPDGSIVAQWSVSFTALFPDPQHILPASEVPATDWHAAIHGMDILPDGSVLFNFDARGMVKLDRCGNPLWTVPRMTHHSIDRAAAGGYWVASRNYVVDQTPYPRYTTPYWDDTILRVSDGGEVLSETSVNRILLSNGLYALLVANGRFESDVVVNDPLHLNDIEELHSDIAHAFPAFAAGDLVLSLRHLNALIVVAPTTWKVKWYQTGPWLRQHDPDFQADGQITVFNNNSDDTKRGEVFGGSRLVSVRPLAPEMAVSTFYGAQPGQRFFSNTQGKHQRLANGNWLIAEYYGGRALEVTSAGETVWAYVNQYDDDHVAKISGALRYPESYFEVTAWDCP